MQFHAEFHPRPLGRKIKHADKIMLAGSCFTEQVGAKLARNKFRVMENPHGILFNPVSIATTFESICSGKIYNEEDLFFHNELWGSWHHHTRFSDVDKNNCLQKINSEQIAASAFVKNADWLIITLGSAFVYEINDTNDPGEVKVAANCHKIPADKFHHRLLGAGEVLLALNNIYDAVIKVNPTINIIFTISPVRHLREGFIENNRSKAMLIQAVHSFAKDNVHYFPSYELIIDDLRDYRFYAEDMVHPNYAATNYVWEKFVSACLDENAKNLLSRINEINAAYQHKPFNPTSGAHEKFLQQNLLKIEALKKEYDYLDFDLESSYFRSRCS